MKVLFVCAVNPFTFGGGAQATRAFLDATLDIYGAKNVDVVVCSEADVPIEYNDIKFIKVPKRSKLSSFIGLFSFQLGRFAKKTYEILRDGNSNSKYDLCIFNSGRESGWVAKRLVNDHCKFVSIHHNFEVQFCMDTKLFTFGGRFPWLVRKVERDAYIYSDVNLFLTDQDLNLFRQEYGHTSAKNNVVGTFDYKSAEIIKLRDDITEYDIAISGSLSDYQTEHGILDLCNNYLQLLKKYLPDVKILLTGRNPTATIQNVARKAPDIFTIISSPLDIHKEVRKASFYVCPTDIGGGLKLRAMDGLKNGLPILVNSVSARGYDHFFDKRYFKIYYDKTSFEKGLKELLEYINETEDYRIYINKDYYSFFGYSSGKERLEKTLKKDE